MATSLASDKPVAASAAGEAFDPFVTSPSGPTHLRHSNFDTSLLALSPGTSAEQVKRAIEAHLRDTERRMEEAGKLGTALVQQRKELGDRLREVEQLQSEGELNSDLRRRLVDIEKDYNDVARESARALLPKQRIPSNEAAQGSPFAPEGKGGRRSVSPSKFESLATGSPTKLSVPNRKLRNQPTSRIHDIEFAAEISTSLISQVRNLQGLLAVRDEDLRKTKDEVSKLEVEAETFQQRKKNFDESESRYNEENWNLETRIRELEAEQTDAAERLKKTQQSLNVLQADKNATQKELEEVKDKFAKQDEKHAVATKNLEIELGTSRRNAAIAESERLVMQRKVEELTSQNQELAKAFSLQRGRTTERESGFGMSDDEFQTATDNGTPEHSPPPSPVKGTPRHSVLESETLKTSLGHAQRTIQTLRTNIHREKTEKLELRRMLQDARDELERSRGDPNANRKSRKVDSKEFKKPLRLGQLGTARLSRTELYLDDPEWEDHGDGQSPRSLSASGSTRSSGHVAPIPESKSDHFDTANEASESAFETAHERATETEDFQTGAEDMSDDDAATETEASPSKGAGRIKRPLALPLNQASNRYSFESTASTSNDEDNYGMSTDLRTPTTQPTQKMRLRVSRGALNRRSRQVSEEPTLQSSPASFAVSSAASTPQQAGQSLFAELGEFEGSDEDSYVGGATPSRRSIRSVTPGSFARGRASPPPEVPALPKVIMIDSGTMTEPVEVKPLPSLFESPAGDSETTHAPEEIDDSVTSRQSVIFGERPMSMDSVIGPTGSFSSTHWLGDELKDGELSRPLSQISYSDASVQHDTDMESKLAQFPSPPTSPPKRGLYPTPILRPPQHLSLSYIQIEAIEPEAIPETPSTPPSLSVSSILSEQTEPIIEPEVPPETPAFSISSLVSENIEPQAEPEPTLPEPPSLSIPAILSQYVEPIAEQESPPSPIALSLSTIHAQDVEPIELQVSSPLVESRSQAIVETPASVGFSFSPVKSEHIEPLSEPRASPTRLSFSPINAEELEPLREPETQPVALSLSTIESQHVQPIQEAETPLMLSLSLIYTHDVEPQEIPASPPPVLSLSGVQCQDIEPILPYEAVVSPPTLSFSAIGALHSEPVEPRSPKRNAFIIPRDVEAGARDEYERSQSPPNIMQGWDATALSADDEPASVRKHLQPTSDQSAQTSLTSEAIDQILNAKNKAFVVPGLERSNSFGSMGTPSTVRVHRPRQASIDSPVRSKGKAAELALDMPESVLRRPGSSASGRASSIKDVPPLPANHKEVIEAARTGSSGGGQGAIGSMGPPLFSASALRNHNAALRPRTPNGSRRPMSPISVNSVINSGRGTPTPRLVARSGSVYGAGEVHSPSRSTHLSRKSSVSSFASEIDSRFNMQNAGGFDAQGFGPNTDPRMIQAITQTMIGEYLWKYTRKAGRGELSGNRHRRYFWVHPYTRTLYWSDRDPSVAGRGELRAKSVPIEAVRVVTDDNPMPPGLHRKSLVIISPGRTIKFTCTTGQRHETWFNALSYLLLRTHNEGQTDAEEMAGHITREDVEEFNPSFGRRPVEGNRAAASLSSYNSRTVRNDSPAIDMSMELPTLTPTHKKPVQGRPPYGTFSRISGYWKDSKVLSGTFGSLRSRSVSGRDSAHNIYEASEVQDSAEDLRQMIERQDREADRLENVRACCEGKHDVGTLTGGSKSSRHARGHIHTHSHSGTSVTQTPAGTVRSRA
ncbi:hypothetical protein B0T26DRAFT_681101 [Lasiosphaeria miniovina]|uniref:PH domain-containing protein n=1 Tax=Lasiosphaeria miniovina TaxID=1954250 RepID=A0AA39ZTH9_9PEZI|nr:uncharacterized protein B0T26DRAFT_681101 [Lasiosphaeria miniovina]KAK0703426.1 hypothetical protein B0T26DRAFT_681101 [Lasiosphaeria miniovina]